MKDYRWIWISFFCLVVWVVVLLWIDSVVNDAVHVRTEKHEVLEEETGNREAG